MIFTTVGTHNEGFNRLIKAVDDYAEKTTEKIIIQKGSSTYTPRYAEHFDFSTSEKIMQLSKQARIIITHAGAGSVLTSLATQALLIVVPRLKKFNEVIDDHQLELAEALNEQKMAYVLHNVNNLYKLISSLPQDAQKQNKHQTPLTSYLQERLKKIEETV